LNTNLDGYLKEGEDVGCMACHKCVRMKDKLLHFKYNAHIKSSYGATFANKRSPTNKGVVFNLDEERRQLKVPYKPPKTFMTTNGLNMKDS